MAESERQPDADIIAVALGIAEPFGRLATERRSDDLADTLGRRRAAPPCRPVDIKIKLRTVDGVRIADVAGARHGAQDRLNLQRQRLQDVQVGTAQLGDDRRVDRRSFWKSLIVICESEVAVEALPQPANKPRAFHGMPGGSTARAATTNKVVPAARDRIKRQTIQHRRPQHRKLAA